MMREKVYSCISKLTPYQGEMDENANLNIYGIDSLMRVELVILLESEFDINFNDSDLTQDNFETINCICNLIGKYEEK